jgi:hypothetical protein
MASARKSEQEDSDLKIMDKGGSKPCLVVVALAAGFDPVAYTI